MLFGLVNKTDNGVKPLLDSLAKHIKAEGLSSMVANAENIVNVSASSPGGGNILYV